MRVCDITKTDECVTVIRIERRDGLDANDEDASAIELHEFDVGQRALDAFVAQDWQQLGDMAAPVVRPSRRSEGAKQAAKTRAENKRKRAAEAEAANKSTVNPDNKPNVKEPML